METLLKSLKILKINWKAEAITDTITDTLFFALMINFSQGKIFLNLAVILASQ